MQTIIAGVIGAAAVIAASIIAAVQAGRAKDAKDDVNELQETIAETSSLREQEYLRRYAFKAASVSDVRTVKDLQGTVEVVRQYQGVKVVDKGISLGYLPGRVWVSPGTITKEPSLIPPPSFSKAVSLVIQSSESQRCEFTVEIAGGLTEGDTGLDYGFRTTYCRGVVITKEEMDQAYRDDVFKNEYVSFDVDFPLDELELRVEFPEQYKVQCFPAVFLAYSECMHGLELQKTRDGFEAMSTGGARFKVKEPLLGFRYAIYWIPPPEKEVDRLRAEG